MRKRIIYFFLPLFLLVVACDSGDIYPDENKHFSDVEVTATFTFEHINAFPDDEYQILFGFFDDDLQKPLVSKVVQKPKKEGDIVSVTINKVPTQSKSVGLVLSNAKTGTTVYVFSTDAMEEIPTNKVVFPTQPIDLLLYERIQKQVFNQCIQCHGGSDRVGAGLYLTEGKSYDNLFNVSSTKSPKLRVKPLEPSQSFVMDILEEKELKNVHASIFTTVTDEDVSLIKEWIKSGAEKK